MLMLKNNNYQVLIVFTNVYGLQKAVVRELRASSKDRYFLPSLGIGVGLNVCFH